MKFNFRLFMPLLAISALTVVLPAYAGDMVTFSGSVRTRGEINDNAGFLKTDNTEMWYNRFRLNIDVAPTSTLKGRVTPQFANTYGDGVNSEISAHEAWFAWTINNMWSLTAGRQTWYLGNGMIVGAGDWGNLFANGIRFDGFKVVASHSLGATLFAYAKLTERTAAAVAPSASTGAADNDLFVVYNMFNIEKQTSLFKNLDLYLLWNHDRQTATAVADTGSLNQFTFGTRVDGTNGAWDYNAELAAQMAKHSANRTIVGVTGATDDGKGLMMNANIGHKYMAHHFAGEFGYFNSEWESVAPANHGRRGNADMFGQNNLMYLAAKTNWGWTDKISTDVNGWWFMAAKDTAGQIGGAGNAATAGTGLGKNGAIGTSSGQRQAALELDFVLNYKAEKNLGMDVGYALVKPMSAIKNVTGQDNSVSKMYLQGNMTF